MPIHPIQLLACLAFAGFAITSNAHATPTHSSTAIGHWEGSIKFPGTNLPIGLDFETSESKLSGTIDIPAQGLRGFKLAEISYSENQFSFALPGIPGDPSFTATFSENGKDLAGNLSQSGQSFPFSVSRAIKQEPKGATPSRGIPGEGLAGAWQGSLRPGAFEMRLLFNIESQNESFVGTLSSLDQDAHNIPISKITRDNDALTIAIEKISGRFEGTLSSDGAEAVGNWIQGANKLPLTIKRLAKTPDLKRSQDPSKPYPYREQEITFTNSIDGIQLSGTLTLPPGEGPHPAVVLISGSGPQDRDEALMGHRPFLVIADRFTRAGIAVLRYDDRGYGKSTGSFKDAITSDFTRDALAAVEFLKTIPQIDPQKIGLAGHSEGGLIAPQVAVANPQVAFIVLLAGVGVPMDKLLARQAEDMLRISGGNAEAAAFQAKLQTRIFQVVKAANHDTELDPIIRSLIEESLATLTEEQRLNANLTPGQIENQIQMITSPWFREILLLDPKNALRQVHCPVLAVNGSKDIQVASAENLQAIKSSLLEGGNQNVTTIEFPNLNHLFQTCETGATHEYSSIEETFNEQALLEISKWIQNTSGLNASPSQ